MKPQVLGGQQAIGSYVKYTVRVGGRLVWEKTIAKSAPVPEVQATVREQQRYIREQAKKP